MDPTSTDVSALGQPLTADPRTHPCLCCTDHNPNPRRNHFHHVVPLAWGGSDAKSNIVSLCPTSHENVHALLRDWERAGRVTHTSLHPYVRELARRAWAGRAEMEARAAHR